MYSSQWSRLLKNIGVWQGSFTHFSPEGKFIKNTPTELKLEGLNNNKSIKFTLTRLDESQPPHVTEFSSLNKSIFLFPEGYFSKGSLQFSPFSTFGAEYGFVIDNRRLRMVQLFDSSSNLEQVTLIREFRAKTKRSERPELSLDQLVGEWEGSALTLYPDWRDSQPYPTHLTIQYQGDLLSQTLKTPELNISSTATINGSSLTFGGGDNQIRVLLLPDGASSTTPLKIKPRQPFFLEMGWLIEPNKRLRLIRQYDDKGSWVNVTLVKERKL
jgi:hypothetical protein